MDADIAKTTALTQFFEREQQWVSEGLLHPSTASFYRRSLHVPTRGLLLCFHGWSACPWQYQPLADVLVPKGVDVCAVRLPGHGFRKADAEDNRFLLKCGEASFYGAYAAHMGDLAYAAASALKVPLYVMGFSGGGAMAVSLLKERPGCAQKAVLAAPFFGPWALGHQRLFERLLWACGRFHAGWLLDRIPYAWEEEDEREKNTGWKRMGHRVFHIGNLVSLYAFVRGLEKTVLQLPVHMVLNDGDETVDREKAWAFYRAQPQATLTHFESFLKVPHALLTPYENPVHEARQKMFDDVVAFLTT